jgi:parafibromin
MASTNDALLLLRQSIASGGRIVPAASEDAGAAEASLSQATHLHFSEPSHVAIPIDAPTRFVSASTDAPVDLRSIYFAWLNREVAIPEYNASATKLNDDLAGTSTVHKFAFVERLDLITWLEGASEESEYIKPLAGDKEVVASAAKAPTTTVPSRAGRGTLDPRLAVIYNGERRLGDHNTGLRGIKPTVRTFLPWPPTFLLLTVDSQDFSHVRKLAASFVGKKTPHSAAQNIANNPSLAIQPKAPERRPDPIILLSPSASSLLRMSNIKSFLESGRYVPPDASSTATMLHLTRTMRDIDPARPLRFILVEGPEQFKPEYWNRVVAVFTTGQTWQFKNYKWSQPQELFRRVLGVYIGWRGEPPPQGVRDWGHRVLTSSVEKWREGPGQEGSRWRDREVVEGIWKAIETHMRSKGWKRDSGPTLT